MNKDRIEIRLAIPTAIFLCFFLWADHITNRGCVKAVQMTLLGSSAADKSASLLANIVGVTTIGVAIGWIISALSALLVRPLFGVELQGLPSPPTLGSTRRAAAEHLEIEDTIRLHFKVQATSAEQQLPEGHDPWNRLPWWAFILGGYAFLMTVAIIWPAWSTAVLFGISASLALVVIVVSLRAFNRRPVVWDPWEWTNEKSSVAVYRVAVLPSELRSWIERRANNFWISGTSCIGLILQLAFELLMGDLTLTLSPKPSTGSIWLLACISTIFVTGLTTFLTNHEIQRFTAYCVARGIGGSSQGSPAKEQPTG